MPRYLALIYSPAEMEGADVSEEEWNEVFEEYTAFDKEAQAAGVVKSGAALHDSNTATTVEVKGGKNGEVVFTDGPFAETKEVLGGFYMLDCEDLDEALKWAQKIPGAWHGKVEVRPVMEFDT